MGIAVSTHITRTLKMTEDLRKLRRDDPEAFKRLISELHQEMEDKGYEVKVELEYEH